MKSPFWHWSLLHSSECIRRFHSDHCVHEQTDLMYVFVLSRKATTLKEPGVTGTAPDTSDLYPKEGQRGS